MSENKLNSLTHTHSVKDKVKQFESLKLSPSFRSKKSNKKYLENHSQNMKNSHQPDSADCPVTKKLMAELQLKLSNSDVGNTNLRKRLEHSDSLDIIEKFIETEEEYQYDLKKREQILRFCDPNDEFENNVIELLNYTEQIEVYSTKFLKDLMHCGNNIDLLADIFNNYRSMFAIYSEYLRHEQKCKNFGNEYKKFGEKIYANTGITLSSYLLAPFQRFIKYKLFLENFSQASNKIQTALKNLDDEINRANDLMAIESIVDCPYDVAVFGQLELRDEFDSNTHSPKKKYMVFLFRNFILITTDEQKSDLVQRYYTDVLHLPKLHITKKHKIAFQLKSVNKKYILEAPTHEIFEKWKQAFETKTGTKIN